MEDKDKKIEDYMEKIFMEMRWIQRNMNPPVNYSFVIIISIISAVITTFILTH